MNLRKLYKSHHNKSHHKIKHDDNVSDPFYFISDEVILYMFAFFDVPDLLTLSTVSKRLKELAGHDELWKSFILNYLADDESSKLNQSCITFFRTQHKTLKMNELFNKVRNEELRFKYFSYSDIEERYHSCPTPLLLSYALSLNINPVAYTQLRTDALYKFDEDTVANHLLEKLPVIHHSNYLILREMGRFVSSVVPSSRPPCAYTHYLPKQNRAFPLLYLYATFRKLAEQNPYEIILFKDPAFFREVNDFLAHNGLQGNKLMILSKTFITHPEILYTQKIIPILKDMLGHLKNTDVINHELFDYYQNSCSLVKNRF